MKPFAAMLLAALSLLAGCAKYQYELVEPARFAQVIPKDREAAIEIDAVDYRFIEDERVLVILIYNNFDDPMTIRGEHSYVVDPFGETHPLRGGTIAPHSYISMVFPPMAAVYRRSGGPRFSFGFGTTLQHHHHSHFHGYYYEPYWVEYVVVAEPGMYWPWKEGEIALRLAFQQGESTFDHQFRFRRVRVD